MNQKRAKPKLTSAVSQPLPENSGGPVNYYTVSIPEPARADREPYIAEAQDIIEYLGMDFNEGEAFKAIWRKAAARTLGMKRMDDNPVRNAEKVVYMGQRMLAVEKRKAPQQTERRAT